jgi:hypothetical protein
MNREMIFKSYCRAGAGIIQENSTEAYLACRCRQNNLDKKLKVQIDFYFSCQNKEDSSCSGDPAFMRVKDDIKMLWTEKT